MKKKIGETRVLPLTQTKRKRAVKQTPEPIGLEKGGKTGGSVQKSEHIRIPPDLLRDMRNHPTKIATLTDNIPLAELGVVIPSSIPRKFWDRFEAGFRHGLRSNMLQNFRMSFGLGFRFAKLFIRLIDPRHPLAVSGNAKFVGHIEEKP